MKLSSGVGLQVNFLRIIIYINCRESYFLSSKIFSSVLFIKKHKCFFCCCYIALRVCHKVCFAFSCQICVSSQSLAFQIATLCFLFYIKIIEGLCMPNPCVHGRCFEGSVGFACQCAAGYRGTLCDEGKYLVALCDRDNTILIYNSEYRALQIHCSKFGHWECTKDCISKYICI